MIKREKSTISQIKTKNNYKNAHIYIKSSKYQTKFYKVFIRIQLNITY